MSGAVSLRPPVYFHVVNGNNLNFTVGMEVRCAGGKIEKNEMGGACSAYGGGERCAQGSGGET